MSRIKVDLKERSYDIYVGIDTLPDLGKQLKEENNFDKIIIITDPLVNDLYGAAVRGSIKAAGLQVETIEVPRGEKYKSLKQAEKLYNKLVEIGAHRDSCIVALGGGVIGDLAGFIAATYMRGMALVYVPTTLLAQVDASIGGKTSVNHPKCKNLIGSFYQPRFVFVDVKTLTTLPERELKTGLAEVIKYGVIEDQDLFKFLEANVHHLTTKAFEEEDTLRAALKVWQTIVAESAKIKARVVSEDEREEGLRMILNFGHTIGHAFETLTRYEKFNHGEAVAIGMVCAANIAKKMRMLDAVSVTRIRELIENLGLPTMVERLSLKRVVKSLYIDKKVRKGKIQFVLPARIGRVEIKDNVRLKVVREILREAGCN